MIPLATETTNRPGTFRRTLTNYYAEKTPQGPRDYILRQRPCLARKAAPWASQLSAGPIHAICEALGRVYILSGLDVYCDGALIGSVEPGGFKQFAASYDQVVLVAGWRAYVVSPTAVTMITDVDLPEVSSVVYLNGVFVFTQRDSDFYFWTAINDATDIDSLSFASAEASPDPIVRAEVLNDELVLFGAASLEFQRKTSNPAAPFVSQSGRTQDWGCASPQAVVKADGGLYFVGADDDGKGIFRTEGGVPRRVSSETVDADLEAVRDDELLDASGFALLKAGRIFYVINIPGRASYALDIREAKWAVWQSYGETNFRITCGSEGYFGDADGYVFEFDAEARTDDGGIVEFGFSAIIPAVKPARVSSLILETETGVSLITGQGSDAVVEMRYTDQIGGDFSDWEAVPLGLTGDRSVRAMWTQQGTVFHPGRLIEVRCTDPVSFSPSGFLMNERVYG